MLETGDLIFVSENTEMGQAIQASTGNYSHVAIFLDDSIYHATVEGGVLAQSPEDMTFIATRKSISKKSRSGQKTF